MTIALILLLVVLLFTLLVSDPGWSNVLSSARNDVVFADRNQRYGAYKIRQEHHRTLIVSFLSASGLVGAGFAIPMLLSAGSFVAPPTFIPNHIIDDVIMDLGKMNPPEPPKPIDPPANPPAKDTRDPHEQAIVIVDSAATHPEWKPDTSLTVNNAIAAGTGTALVIGSITPIGGSSGGLDTGGGGGDTHLKFIWQLDAHPEFPGGQKGLTKFLDREVRYPEASQVLGHEGTVWVEFVVEVDGSVARVRVLRPGKKELDAEAVRAVRRMPRWKPGMIGDEPVPFLHQQKIVFELGR